MKKILFIGEAVTLSHAARPFVLAKALDRNNYEVLFACDPRCQWILKDSGIPFRAIHSISSEDFLKSLANGTPVYDPPTLRAYVKEDLELIKEFQPDLIVGDFRLSLAVSAELAHVSYVSITNAYWSPYAQNSFPVPDLPMFKILGRAAGKALFKLIRPFAFAYHCRPLNQVRKEFGLPSLGHDLRQIYTHADYTLYADHPEFAPTFNLPANHRYLGPISWTAEIPFPDWWDQVPMNQSVMYVNLGSSGNVEQLPSIIRALSQLPVTVLVATAGRITLGNMPPNVFVADYLPGQECSAMSAVVITNGGAPSTMQALQEGTPAIGIASNTDQLLNMRSVQLAGAGLCLRAQSLTPELIKKSAEAVLSNPSFKVNATRAAMLLSEFDAPNRFQTLIEKILSEKPQLMPHDLVKEKKS